MEGQEGRRRGGAERGPEVSEPLLSAREIAPLLGLKQKRGWETVLLWRREGKIPAAIAEPNLIRFDLQAVRSALAERAQKGGCR